MITRAKRLSVSPVLTWLVAGLCSLACLLWFRNFFPPPSYDTYIVTFFIFAAGLGASLFGLGHLVCCKIFKIPHSGVELAVGMGTLALFLSFYLKVTINPTAPLTLLLLGFVISGKLIIRNRKEVIATLNQNSAALFVNLWIIILLTLSFTTSSDSLLLFPNDFDSDLIHVTAPKIAIDRGVFFTPNWLRGAWLPQLTMGLYTFILSISGQTYLKILNVICFAQIGMLFMRSSRGVVTWPISLAMFALLTALPEFRQYLVQANLDTTFALFTVSAFFMLLEHIRSPSCRSLMLITLLCGFSAGQKHFGLMYSIPILGLASLLLLFEERTIKSLLSRLPLIGASGILFCATFAPFYLHNVLAGNSLLFPFIGSSVNTYGWDAADLKQMIESTIPHWGYSKTLGGYFLLPLHLLQHPDKYQFYISQTWADWGMSVAIGTLYTLALAGFLFKPIRTKVVIIPALAICLNIALWYRGSQVIRYLFPVLISTILLTSSLLTEWFTQSRLGQKLKSTILGMSLVSAVLVSSSWIIPPRYPLAQSENDIQSWLTTYRGSNLAAFNWLAQNTPPGSGILNIGGANEMMHFPQLVLCGDWFGRCRYTRFLTTYIQFKPWPELKGALRANDLTYIVVNWEVFSPHSKLPSNEAEWNKALPPSTRECLEHAYSDGKSTDIYKVRLACLE